jgi:hypothetical protein
VKIVSEAWGTYDAAKGAGLAVDQLAPALQDLGIKAAYAAYDNQNDVDLAAANLREFIADDQVLCGVGPFNSRVTLNVMDLYYLAGPAFVSPSASHPDVSSLRYLEVNRSFGRDHMLAPAAAKFVADQGLQTVYIVSDGSDFSSQAARLFRAEASASGLTVLGDVCATSEMEYCEAGARLMQAAEPAAVLYSLLTWQAGPFFKSVREAGYIGMLLAAEPNPDLALLAGPLALECEGIFYVNSGAPVTAAAPRTTSLRASSAHLADLRESSRDGPSTPQASASRLEGRQPWHRAENCRRGKRWLKPYASSKTTPELLAR